MAITKAITYPPRVGFRLGSMRDSGMVSGSKGYGPAGAGGQAQGPSGNQGGNQRGPSKEGPGTINNTNNPNKNTGNISKGLVGFGTKGGIVGVGPNYSGKSWNKPGTSELSDDAMANPQNYSSAVQGLVSAQKSKQAAAAAAAAERTKQINQITSLYGDVTQDPNLSSYNKSLGLGLKDLSNMSFENRQAYSQSLTDAFNEATQAQTTKQALDASAVDKSQEGETAAQRLSGIVSALGEDIRTDISNLSKKGVTGVLSDLGSLAYSGLKAPISSTGMALTTAEMLGDMFNTRYSLNEDGTISSSLTAKLGLPDYTNLHGLASAQNLIGYENMSPEEQEAAQQGILRDIVTFDDSPKGYTVDFSDIDKTKYSPGSDLAAAAREAAASVGGNKGGGAADPIVTNTGTGSGDDGGDDGGDDDTGSGKTYTEAEERTMRYLAEMGYDRGYAEDYIDQGGTLFNFDIYDDTDFVSDYINT